MVRETNQLIAAAAAVTTGSHVLDLGSGHGEPALSFSQLVGPTGHVTATDLSAEMLLLAQENAGILGLTNIAFAPVDASDLPFPAASFDAVTSRFGAMYFPDPAQTFAEILRVLRPMGRAAFAVWGHADTVPWYAEPMRILRRCLTLPIPDPAAPGPFRFGVAGSLSGILKHAGWSDVQEATHAITLTWPGPAAAYVAFIEALHCGLIAQSPEGDHQQIHAELFEATQPFERDGVVKLPGTVIVAAGSKSPS